MFKSDYDQIIRENFDLTDRYTRRYIATLEDAGQEQLLSALSSALYDKIVTKVDDIDFDTIPLSRGDITKVEGFSGTEECLSIIRRIVLEYKQNPAVVDVVLTSIQNIKDRRSLFIKAYGLNVELPMLIYNTIVLAIERSTSLMIATSIEYIKDPVSSSPKAALDKVAYQKTMDDLLFKQLISFNNMCHNGSLDKTLDQVMKHPVFKEDVAMQYNAIAPIAEDPENGTDAIENPVDDNPFTTDDTVEPAVNKEPEVPVAEPELTGDTEVPAANEFPEDVPEETTPDEKCENPCAATADETCGTDECNLPGATVPTVEEDDIDIDTPIVPNEVPAEEEITDDQTEEENIPTVVPSDDVTDSKSVISEEDESDETNNPIQVSGDKTEPVEEFAGVTIAATVGAILSAPMILKTAGWVITHLIEMIRSIIYTVYYTELKFSDYLSIQADLIEANANELKYSDSTDLTPEQKEKSVKKQMKWVDRLRKWSNKFAIDQKKSTNNANRDIQKDSKEKKTIAKNQNGDDSIF